MAKAARSQIAIKLYIRITLPGFDAVAFVKENMERWISQAMTGAVMKAIVVATMIRVKNEPMKKKQNRYGARAKKYCTDQKKFKVVFPGLDETGSFGLFESGQ